MSDTQHRRRRLRAVASVTLVLTLSGWLFAASARLARADVENRRPQDLAALLDVEEERATALSDQVTDLRAEVDRLAERNAVLSGVTIPTPSPADQVAAGLTPVTGPGLTVVLDDAPTDGALPTGARPDDLVVHQQDLQAVVNALWAGGAEAMALMDQRVIATSAFQCIGNVLALHGRRYSPPYTVRAIGDPAKLRAALDASPEVALYLEYVEWVGLGWQVTQGQALELPAYSRSGGLRYASVPEGTDVFGKS